MKAFIKTSVLLAVFIFPAIGKAQLSVSEVPQGLTLQGRIIQPDGQPLEESNVAFNIKVLSPGAESCVLFEENRIVNMTNSNGMINFAVGASEPGATTVSVGHSLPIHKILKNSGSISGLTKCESGTTTYIPQPGDTRKVRVTFTVGSETVALSPDFSLKSVPYAMESENAVALAGKKVDDFVQVSTNVTQSKIETLLLPANFNGLLSLLNPSSSSPSSGSIGIPTSDGGSPSRDGLMRYDPITHNVQISVDGVWRNVITSNGGGVAPDSVVSESIANGSITTEKLANQAVTNAKIADGAITFNKIANGSISTNKIVDSAVTSAKILSVEGSKVTGDIPGKAAGFNGNLDGDVSGAQGSTTVQKIQGRAVASTAPATGQALKWNGSQWVPQDVLPATGVGAGWYGSATTVPRFYVDSDGRITSVSNVALSVGTSCGSTVHGRITITNSCADAIIKQCINGSTVTIGTVRGTSYCDGDGDGTGGF